MKTPPIAQTTVALVCSIIFAAFLSPARADKSPALAIETLAKSTKSWNGKSLPVYPEGQPEVTILRITIPPGTRLPLHEHPVINAGVLLKGELAVHTKDGETKTLQPGDALIELVNEWHYGESIGTEPAEILVVYAGIEGEPITVKADKP